MKISIITATFNNEQTITKTLESVAFQDYHNIEQIIIDGGSTDNTLKIVEKFNHISKIISERDNGIYYALNKGILLSTGAIIGFLHADDFFVSSSILSKISLNFKKFSADAVYGDLDYVAFNNTHKIIRHWKSNLFETKMLRKGWMPPHPTFYVKKEVFEKLGKFDTDYNISADYELILRFLSNNIEVKYIPEVFVKMRLGGISNRNLKNIIRKSKEDYKAIKKNKIGGIYTLFNKNFLKIHQFFK